MTPRRPAAPRDDGVNIADGSWHMVTLSSSWWGPGYTVFVDGVERGALMPGAQRSTANETDREVEVSRGTASMAVRQGGEQRAPALFLRLVACVACGSPLQYVAAPARRCACPHSPR